MKKVLDPIWFERKEFDELETLIAEHLRKEMYLPLKDLLDLRSDVLENASTSILEDAIKSGRITFWHGEFRGKLNARLTKELKSIGAKWDKKKELFTMLKSDLPEEILKAVNLSEIKFLKTQDRISRALERISPQRIADKFKANYFFDSSIFKMEKKIEDTLKNLTVVPKLTDKQRALIAKDYNNNMKLYIKDWTEREIKSLREKMLDKTFAGMRHEEIARTIQRSYGVSKSKAKFLARQESNLLLSKFRESRYEKAGVKKYVWTTVVGSKDHPVRPEHAKLNGKVFSFDKPPIVNKNGDRKNPGEDYNCRCVARPVLEF